MARRAQPRHPAALVRNESDTVPSLVVFDARMARSPFSVFVHRIVGLPRLGAARVRLGGALAVRARWRPALDPAVASWSRRLEIPADRGCVVVSTPTGSAPERDRASGIAFCPDPAADRLTVHNVGPDPVLVRLDRSRRPAAHDRSVPAGAVEVLPPTPRFGLGVLRRGATARVGADLALSALAARVDVLVPGDVVRLWVGPDGAYVLDSHRSSCKDAFTSGP